MNLLKLCVNDSFICNCFSEHAEKYGFGVVDRFVGHGVGTIFHSEPLVYHHRKYSQFCTHF